MKKKLITLLVGIFLLTNIEAKEVETLKCDDLNTRLYSFIEGTKTPIVFADKDYSVYYTWSKGNKCDYVTAQEMLDLYNQPYTENILTFENNQQDNVLTVNKYNFKTTNGFSLNKKDYDENTEYYYLNEEYNAITKFDDEYDKDDEYYVKSYFKHVESTQLDSSKEYYTLKDPNNNLFEIIDAEEQNNVNILSVYEIIEEKDSLISTKKYSIASSKVEQMKSENLTDNEIVESNMLEINENLYMNVIYKNDKGEVTKAYLYNQEGDLLEKYNDRVFVTTNNYVVSYSKDNKQYEIRNQKLKVLNEISFDKANEYNMAYSVDNGIYISLTSNDETNTYFYEVKETSIAVIILISLLIIIPLGCLYFFVLKKKNINIKDLFKKKNKKK